MNHNRLWRRFLLLFVFIAIPAIVVAADADDDDDENAALAAQPVKASAQQGSTDVDEEIKDEPADVQLNFENASLAAVVSFMTEQKKVSYLPNKDLDNVKVSLITKEPLTLTKAWDIMLTLLEMNGYTMINVNGVYRFVSNKDNGNEPLPIYSSANGIDPEQLPSNDKVIRYIYYLKNINSDMATSILAGMLPSDKSVQVLKDFNILFITEKSQYIKSAMKVIKVLDQTGLRQSIKTLALQYTDCDTISQLLNNDLIGSKDKQDTLRFITPNPRKKFSFFSSDMRIISDLPRNALIFLGLDAEIDKVIAFIKKFIDVEQNSAESRLHIREVKYLDPQDLAKLLTALVKPPPGATRLADGDFRFFDDVIITAENPKVGDDSNYGSGSRLIVGCNKEDWKRLEKLIDKLDKPQPQVGLEVLVADVTTQQNLSLGAQLRAKANFPIQFQTANVSNVISGANSDNSTNLRGSMMGALTAGSDRTALSFGDPTNPWLVIKQVLAKTGTNIISQPFLVTNNRQECTFTLGESRQVPGKIRGSSGSGGAITTGIRELISAVANNTITITPRINALGTIDMTIEIDLSDFIAGGDSQAPDKTTRNLTTRVSIGIGEVLVLGGMSKSNQSEIRRKTPLFGDIPFISNLFKYKSKDSTKTDLLIFIRPSIIKPIENSTDEYTQLKLDYAKYQITKNDSYGKDKDPIQRWFFKPRKASVATTLRNLEAGRFAQIDNFAEGKNQPRSVNLAHDPFYQYSEAIAKKEPSLFSRRTKIPTLADIGKQRVHAPPARKRVGRSKASPKQAIVAA